MNKKIKILGCIVLTIVIISIVIVVCVKQVNKAEKIFPDNVVNIYDVNISQNEIDTRKVKEAIVPVFMYHSVTDDLSYIEYSENAVSPKNLEEQLKYIKENKFDTLFFDELSNIRNYDKPIILTFDDGFEDFYTNVFPLLKKYNIKATVFMIVGYINCKYYCTLDQLKQINESGLVKIESHTVTHPDLTSLNSEKLNYELDESKQKLNEYLAVNSTVICYPYGSYNKNIMNTFKEKYNYGVTIDEGIYNMNKNDKYLIPRIYVKRSMNINTFSNKLKNSKVILE